MKKTNGKVVLIGVIALFVIGGTDIYHAMHESDTPSSSAVVTTESSSSSKTNNSSSKVVEEGSDDSNSTSRSSSQKSGSTSELSTESIINGVTPDMTGSDLQRKGAEVIHEFISSKQFNTLLLDQPLHQGVTLEAMYDPDTGDTKFVGNHYLLRGEVRGPQGNEYIYYSLNNNNGQVAYQPDSRALPHMEDTGAQTSLQQEQVQILADNL